MIQTLQEVLEKEVIGEEELAILSANIDILSDKDKVRFGFIEDTTLSEEYVDDKADVEKEAKAEVKAAEKEAKAEAELKAKKADEKEAEAELKAKKA